MKRAFTPRELADAIGVSESSLRRWIDSGAIQTARTLGGHRRISMAEAVRFIRHSHSTVVRPELLGLAEVSQFRSDSGSSPDQSELLFEALRAGDATRAGSLLMSLYLAGQSVAALCDGPLRAAMHRIGELWEHDKRGILIEHRATDICLCIVNQLRGTFPVDRVEGPVALGGAIEGDPYMLPSLMVAAVLGEAGFHEINYGANTPVELLAEAATDEKATIVWVSISHVADAGELDRQVTMLASRLSRNGVPLLLGGRAAPRSVAVNRPNVHCAGSMAEVAAFAKGLLANRAKPESGDISR